MFKKNVRYDQFGAVVRAAEKAEYEQWTETLDECKVSTNGAECVPTAYCECSRSLGQNWMQIEFLDEEHQRKYGEHWYTDKRWYDNETAQWVEIPVEDQSSVVAGDDERERHWSKVAFPVTYDGNSKYFNGRQAAIGVGGEALAHTLPGIVNPTMDPTGKSGEFFLVISTYANCPGACSEKAGVVKNP